MRIFFLKSVLTKTILQVQILKLQVQNQVSDTVSLHLYSVPVILLVRFTEKNFVRRISTMPGDFNLLEKHCCKSE